MQGLQVQGKLLVAPNGAPLPPMCLKCGGQPTVWRPVRYQYTPPLALYFLGWLGIVLFTKRSSFQIPLCEQHRATWVKWNWFAGLSWLPGLFLCVLGGGVSAVSDDLGGVMIVLGTITLLVGLIVGLVVRSFKIVMTTKIDATQSWLRGVHPSVLQAVSSGGAVAPGYAPAPAYGAPQQPPPGYPGYGM
jgi:hypothetical protein